jgi:glucose/arabinose dehydrogenase
MLKLKFPCATKRITPQSLVVAALCAATLVAQAARRDVPFIGEATEVGPNPQLAKPNRQLIPKVRVAKAVGWQAGGRPKVPDGFAINAYADDLEHPRWLYVLPNGDVLVAETNAPERKDEGKGLRGWFMKKAMSKAGATPPSADRIRLLRDADHDGIAERNSIFAKNLHSPFGMALIGNDFYVANTDAIVKFRYTPGDISLPEAYETVAALPAGTRNHHWTKNIIASRDGKYLYATVGSNSNVAEHGMDQEENRAAILRVDLATRAVTAFATGLRNPNGLAWQPRSGQLWTAVNERDEIGDLLVPDYITSVRPQGFYGWPYSYYGQHVDTRVRPRKPDLVAQAIAPDYAVGSHTASLGLVFYDTPSAQTFPPRYRHGAFIGQHGSWNRSDFAGYQVAFVPFNDAGMPAGALESFVTGFINEQGAAMGRPVGVAVDGTGALLVADDVGNKVWRVTAQQQAQ